MSAIDPLNSKEYRSITSVLIVKDVKRALEFYANAFGFETVTTMPGADGNLEHAEMQFRDTRIMIGPESTERNMLSPKSIGNTPVSLYVYVENADDVHSKAVEIGGTETMPLTDMFWGDRCGRISDPDGHSWMISTHVAEPTPEEMMEAIKQGY